MTIADFHTASGRFDQDNEFNDGFSHEEQSSAAGLWTASLRHSLLEMAVLFGALLAIDYALTSFSFNELSPHPYWLVVILISSQFGTGSGIIAAIVASCLHFLTLPAQASDQDYYSYLIQLCMQPATWLGTAIILGELRSRHIGESIQLEEEALEMRAQRNRIAEHCTLLQSNIDDLQHQVATGNAKTLGAALEELQAISSLQADQFETELPGHLVQLIGECTVSLHVRSEDGLKCVYRQGETGSLSSLRLPVQHAVAEQGRSLTVFRDTDASILEERGIYAGPLRDPSNNRIYGIMLIEHLDTAQVSSKNEPLFAMICQSVGTAASKRFNSDPLSVTPLQKKNAGRLGNLHFLSGN